MTRFVLDKNPEQNFNPSLSDFLKILEANTMNFIMYSNPFLKTAFLNKLILATKLPVIYLDFDLLFSGYITSKTIPQSEQITIYHPNRTDLLETIKKILLEISEKKVMLIIDSLNGLYSLYPDNKDAGRLINSYIMLFCSIAKNSNSKVLISGMTRRKNNEEWVLSITGRHIFETKQMNSFWLEKQNSSFLVNILDEKAHPKKSFTMQISSELI